MRTRNELETIYLTDHQQHIEMLSRLRKLTRRIVIVQIDGEVKDDPLIVNALSMMELITKRQTRKWFSTKTFGTPGVEYVFQNKRKFFDFLTGYDAFLFPCLRLNMTVKGIVLSIRISIRQMILLFSTRMVSYCSIPVPTRGSR